MARHNLWPTPSKADGDGGHLSRGGDRKDELLLKGMVKLWPTPRNNTGPSMDAKHMSLDGAVRLFPTATAGDAKNTRNSTAIRHKIPPTGIHAGDTLTDAVVPQGGSLNPNWVEWLMGYPIGHTACEDSHENT